MKIIVRHYKNVIIDFKWKNGFDPKHQCIYDIICYRKLKSSVFLIIKIFLWSKNFSTFFPVIILSLHCTIGVLKISLFFTNVQVALHWFSLCPLWSISQKELNLFNHELAQNCDEKDSRMTWSQIHHYSSMFFFLLHQEGMPQ